MCSCVASGQLGATAIRLLCPVTCRDGFSAGNSKLQAKNAAENAAENPSEISEEQSNWPPGLFRAADAERRKEGKTPLFRTNKLQHGVYLLLSVPIQTEV